MIYPAAASQELAGWADLEAELKHWEAAQRSATFWWRDDDAVAWTPALARLLELAGETPLALAVIPADAEAALAEHVRGFSSASVLQHGWAHRNQAPLGEKKSELTAARPPSVARTELARGRERLVALFGDRALPVLVPPWNRIAPELVGFLPGIGITGLSTIRPRAARTPIAGLCVANVHVDLIDWRSGRGFVGEGVALAGVLRHLRQRRLAQVDRVEPTGLLTHHLIQDAATAAFLAEFQRRIAAHPAASWVAATEIFAAS